MTLFVTFLVFFGFKIRVEFSFAFDVFKSVIYLAD